MDIRKTRLDREKSNAIIRAIAATDKAVAALPPEPADCAVLGQQNRIRQASAQPLPGHSGEMEKIAA
jgi:hypothetical protein